MRFRKLRILLSSSVLILVAARICQLFVLTDERTGHFPAKFKVQGYVVSTLIVLAALGVSIAATKVHRKPKRMPKVNKPLGLISFAFSIVCIADIFVNRATMETGLSLALSVVSAVICAIFFFAYGLKALVKYKLPDILYIFPLISSVLRLIRLFIRVSSMSIIADNVFAMLANCATVLFFLEFAKAANNFDTEKCYKKLLSTGFAAVIFCLVSSGSHLVAIMAVKQINIHEDLISCLICLATGLFVWTFILAFFSGNNLRHRHHHHENRTKTLGSSQDTVGFYSGDDD